MIICSRSKELIQRRLKWDGVFWLRKKRSDTHQIINANEGALAKIIGMQGLPLVYLRDEIDDETDDKGEDKEDPIEIVVWKKPKKCFHQLLCMVIVAQNFSTPLETK